MTRRGLLFSGLALAESDELCDALNKFADAYNAFTKQLAEGKHDLKLSAKVWQAWERGEKVKGWPRG